MGDLPPRAAIARRYRERALSPATLRRALRGEIAIGKALRGLVALAQSEPLSPVAGAIAAELARFPGPVLIVLGERDATAQTFGALWQGEHYRRLRARADREVVRVPNATHTFPGEAARALAGQVLRFVAACSG